MIHLKLFLIVTFKYSPPALLSWMILKEIKLIKLFCICLTCLIFCQPYYLDWFIFLVSSPIPKNGSTSSSCIMLGHRLRKTCLLPLVLIANFLKYSWDQKKWSMFLLNFSVSLPTILYNLRSVHFTLKFF